MKVYFMGICGTAMGNAALLADFIPKGRRNIGIASTHEKTKTTALTAFLLRENGRDPGFLIGGVPQDPPVGNHLGVTAGPFVIEGDEYDSAFFDQRSKVIFPTMSSTSTALPQARDHTRSP